MSERLKGWDLRLIKYVGEELETPFDWLLHNCGHLMGSSVIACLGDEHPSLEELYFTTEEKTRAFPIVTTLQKHFLQLPTTLMAQRGDLVVVTVKDVEVGCVVLDGYIVGKSVEPNRSGKYVYRLPLSAATVAFRV